MPSDSYREARSGLPRHSADRERMDDLVPTLLRFFVRLVDRGTDADGDHRLFRCCGIASEELNLPSAVGRLEVGHPAEVESLHAEAQKVGVKGTRCRDVLDAQICSDTCSSH